MPAGFTFNLTAPESDREVWRVNSLERYSGGFNLDTTNISGVIPPACPLVIDTKERTAKVVRNVKAYDDIDDTELKIEKGAFPYVGMHLGTGSKGATVSAIVVGDEYDTLTLSATITGVKVGDVLFEASAVGGTTVKNKANALNYSYTNVEEGATVTAVMRAFEIRESKLYVPISSKDKETLGDLFVFVY